MWIFNEKIYVYIFVFSGKMVKSGAMKLVKEVGILCAAFHTMKILHLALWHS